MRSVNIENIVNLISAQRFGPYLLECKENFDRAYSLYLYNIKLCESLYVSLNILEISLRNSLNNLFVISYGDNWLLDTSAHKVLSENEIKDVERARYSLERRGVVINTDNLVAELNFGFWNSLFNKYYDSKIWQRDNFLKIVFPNLPRKLRSAKYIRAEIKEIRTIRNRVFHHEPIWNNKLSVKLVHEKICTFIRAMSEELDFMRHEVDRFPSIFTESVK